MANFSDLITYFENIARNHVLIQHTDAEKHFFRMELDELLGGFNIPSARFPFLVLEGYAYDYTDNRSDNVLKKREGAFVLMDYVKDVTDYDAVHVVWDKMEKIADDILARIRADKRNPKTPVIRDFNLENVQVSLILNEINNSAGLRVKYTLTSPSPVEVIPENWLDL